MTISLFRPRDRKLDLLAALPLFADLRTAELRRIAPLVDVVDVEAGRVLIHQGHRGREFFVLVDGEVAVDVDGEEIARLGAGEFFGELAIMEFGPRTASVTVATAGRVLVVSSRAFSTLLDAEPTVASRVLRAVADRQGALAARGAAA